MEQSRDIVIVGGGVAGSALAAVLARQRLSVAVLERELIPVDRVRGEYAPPWGVAELKRLGLLDCLLAAGGIFAVRNVPYDENTPGEAARDRDRLHLSASRMLVFRMNGGLGL